MKFKKIYIELSDICGLNCSFCPINKNIRGIISLDLFEKSIKEIQQYTNLIALHVLGDPMKLNNDLDSFLNIIATTTLKVELTTSGAYLNNFPPSMIFNSPIKQINFSLNALMEIKDYYIYVDHIINFCHLKLNQAPNLFINLRLQNLTDKKTMLIKEYLLNHFNIHEYEINDRIRLASRIKLTLHEKFNWNNNKFPSKRGFCHALSKHIAILSNGNVVPCCMDARGEIILGNLNNSTLFDILHTKRAKDIKEGFKKGELIEEKCQRCDYIKRFK